MRSSKKLSIILPLCVVLLPLIVDSALAEPDAISIGPWKFDNAAFADAATQLDTGSIDLRGEPTDPADLNEALTGYSPRKMLVNIGNGSNANLFQLDFTDLKAVNQTGPDIVFFEGVFAPETSGDDPFEIAVRPEGGSFTGFVAYSASEFIDTGEPCISGCTVFGLEIDLDDFGLPAGTVVDAIQFRALNGVEGFPEGDPVMAAVLTGYTAANLVFLPVIVNP